MAAVSAEEQLLDLVHEHEVREDRLITRLERCDETAQALNDKLSATTEELHRTEAKAKSLQTARPPALAN